MDRNMLVIKLWYCCFILYFHLNIFEKPAYIFTDIHSSNELIDNETKTTV